MQCSKLAIACLAGALLGSLSGAVAFNVDTKIDPPPIAVEVDPSVLIQRRTDDCARQVASYQANYMEHPSAASWRQWAMMRTWCDVD